MNIVQFLIYYILCIFTTFATSLIICKLINLKIKYNFKSISLIITYSLPLVINNLYNISLFKMLVSFILLLTLISIITKCKLKKIIPYLLFYTIISLLFEIIISLTLFVNIKNIVEINKLTIFKCSISIIHTLFIYLFFKMHFIKKFVNKTIEIMNNYLNFNIILIIAIMIIMIIIIIRGTSFQDKNFILYEIICTFYIIVCLKTIIKDKYNNYLLTNKNRIINETNKAYSKTIEDCRELKHNLKNDLIRIKSSLPNNKQKDINDIIIKYNTKYEWINKINDIPSGLQGILYLKILEAKDKKVKIFINTQMTSKIDEKDYTDLCDILGIIIDNAIEASLETKNKFIDINIIETKNDINFKIMNTFNNSIDITKLGTKNYSTKKRNSGIGLYYIYKMKNKNIKIDNKIINNVYITNIIYRKNSK